MKKAVQTVIALAILAALIFLFGDGERVIEELTHANLAWIMGAILVSIAAYVCVAMSLREAGRAVRLLLPLRTVLGISFASAIINHIAVGAGAGTVAVRLHLLSRFGVPAAHGLSVTGLSSIASNFSLCLVAGLGLVIIVAEGSLSPWQSAAAAGVLIVIVAVTVLGLIAFVKPSWRTAFVNAVTRALNAVYSFFRRRKEDRFCPRRFLDDMDQSLSRIERPVRALGPVAFYSIVDWALGAVALGMCFQAVGEDLPWGVVISGYAAGVLASFVAFLPGGLGILEASMTGVFNHFGVEWEVALGATLIYRFAYFLLPSVFCVAFFGRRAKIETRRAVRLAHPELRGRNRRLQSKGRAS